MPYKPSPNTQCQHRSQLNRRCRLPIAPTHPALCAFHARAAAQAETRQNAQLVATELLAGTENFSTPANVNLFLGNLLKNFANHQVSRRDATTLAYISQLLLNSHSVMHRQAKDAQAAATAAKAAEPQRIVIDMPRPNRGHLDDPPSNRSDGSSTPASSCNGTTPAPTSSCSGGSSDPLFSPSSSAGESSDSHASSTAPLQAPTTRIGTTLSTTPSLTPTTQITTPPENCHPERSEGSAFPPGQPHVNDPATPNTPTPNIPPPHANKVLYHPDDDDPANRSYPLPTRSLQRVYGFSDRFRRHRYGATQHFSPLTARHAPLVHPERRLRRSAFHSPLATPHSPLLPSERYLSAAIIASSIQPAVKTKHSQQSPARQRRNLRRKRSNPATPRPSTLSATLLDSAATAVQANAAPNLMISLFGKNEPVEPSLLDKLKASVSKTKAALSETVDTIFQGQRKIDPALLKQLETALLSADIGVATTKEILQSIREKLDRSALSDASQLKREIKSHIVRILNTPKPPATPSTNGTGTRVIFIVGVNGAGKTTSIGKLANRLKQEGRSVVLCAADTFRAAAIEQLAIWAERNGIEMIKQKFGADPAAVVYDAVAAAKARGADIVIVDTAGRLHTKSNLMAELEKMKRTAAKVIPGAPHEVLLVLDATTGQNGLAQAREFTSTVGVTGIILTKLDGTAKGGIVVPISRELNLPIRFVGTGEQINDMVPFDAETYADSLFT
jgi:fused signal recognition particle receptor